GENPKSQAVSRVVVVNFTNHTVEGLWSFSCGRMIGIINSNEITISFACIDKEGLVYEEGEKPDSEGHKVAWHFSGSINRVTGDLNADVRSMSYETGKFIGGQIYRLNCTAAERKF